jgi:histidinol phosphatase-like enzyme
MKKPVGTYVVDIDGTICSQDGDNYTSASPKPEIIEAINDLFRMGNEIILFTARGSTTGIDWHSLTQTQLTEWGVKYTRLQFGKPFGNYYIDDKNMSIRDFVQHVRSISC